jgi:holo-[acyl-carrier protein] synthase
VHSLRIGIDLVEVSKVEKVFGDRKALQEEVFTQAEIRYSMRQRRPLVHLAERFAIKEALFKALGTGLNGEIDWRDVELQKGTSGKASLGLWGETAQVARNQGLIGYSFSFSHTDEYAVALVLLVISGPS